MEKINILLANANNYFTNGDIQTIRNAVRQAEKYISSRFDEFDYNLDLLVTHPTLMQATIPEDGIGGRTYNSRLLTVVIDKSQSPVSADRVYEIACHELSHSLRWEKVPEYAETLFGEMILEGLAVVLEEQAVKAVQGSKMQFFLRSMLDTTQGEYESIIETLKPSLFTTEFNYNELFYLGNDNVPRWAGYRLGYFYVMQYLKRTGRTIEQATLDSYKEFRIVI